MAPENYNNFVIIPVTFGAKTLPLTCAFFFRDQKIALRVNCSAPVCDARAVQFTVLLSDSANGSDWVHYHPVSKYIVSPTNYGSMRFSLTGFHKLSPFALKLLQVPKDTMFNFITKHLI